MEGARGGYYDTSGAMRDVLQNHVLQLLCLIAMDPPSLFQAREIRDEKMKVLQALRPGISGPIGNWAIRGQYSAGLVNRQPALAYREEQRVSPTSNRETYVAMRVALDNWRWAGVPFYLRTGKRLPKQLTEVAIQFKNPPLNLFSTVECDGDLCDLVETRPNQLILRIQPQEAISLRFSTKRPGMNYQVQPVSMDFAYDEHFDAQLPEAYERLLLDVMRYWLLVLPLVPPFCGVVCGHLLVLLICGVACGCLLVLPICGVPSGCPCCHLLRALQVVAWTAS